jgi:hypothetical protein
VASMVCSAGIALTGNRTPAAGCATAFLSGVLADATAGGRSSGFVNKPCTCIIPTQMHVQHIARTGSDKGEVAES